MVDTIKDFIFDNIIKTYKDVKNKSAAVQIEASSGAKLTPEARSAVQKISQLVANKT
jgi:hypothetical protein